MLMFVASSLPVSNLMCYREHMTNNAMQNSVLRLQHLMLNCIYCSHYGDKANIYHYISAGDVLIMYNGKSLQGQSYVTAQTETLPSIAGLGKWNWAESIEITGDYMCYVLFIFPV